LGEVPQHALLRRRDRAIKEQILHHKDQHTLPSWVLISHSGHTRLLSHGHTTLHGRVTPLIRRGSHLLDGNNGNKAIPLFRRRLSTGEGVHPSLYAHAQTSGPVAHSHSMHRQRTTTTSLQSSTDDLHHMVESLLLISLANS